MDGFWDILTDFTVRNAVLGAALLGILSGVLGTFAVLREQSLLGDALSHAALPGICIGFLIAGGRQLWPLVLGALAAGAVAALLVLLLTNHSRLKPDASVGVILSTFFAAGTVLLTYIQSRQLPGQAGLDSFLFGQAAALLPSDLWVMAGVAALGLGLIALLWKEFKLITFDPGFARSLGWRVPLLEAVLTSMIALAVVIGLQMVGVVLMVAMIIAPAAAARQWARRLETMVALAAVFGAASGVFGTMVSLLRPGLATGPLIVLAATGIVIVSLLLAPQRGLLWQAVQRRRTRAAIQSGRVLVDLLQLARAHGDDGFATEQGMIDAVYGADSQPVLRQLERQGLVKPVPPRYGKARQWQLTTAGQAEAQRLMERREE